MEEKKLTDKEILKALEICTTEKCEEMDYGDNLADCPLRNEKYCVRKLTKNAVDLIHRLQDENTELREDVERWEAVFKITEERKYRKMFNEEWKKEYQKELDKEGEGLIAGSPDFDYVYELYFKQKAEIERLKTFIDFKTANVVCEKCKRQAVKDTAKVILQELSDFVDFETFREGYELTKVKRKIKEIATRKGVEVE